MGSQGENPDSTTGIEGVSYHKQVYWTSKYLVDLPRYINTTSDRSCIDNIHEEKSGSGHRYLRIVETKSYPNSFGLYDVNSSVVNSIPISLNLKDMNYPKKYKVLFYVSAHLDDLTKISDYTNWLDIPQPKFFLSFPNKLEFRPDESSDVSELLKSVVGL